MIMVKNNLKYMVVIFLILVSINLFAKNTDAALDNYYEGMKLFENNDFVNAEIKLKKALELNGELNFANVMLGMIESNRGDYIEALKRYAAYLSAPNEANLVTKVRIKMAYCDMKIEKWEDALQELNKVPENERDSQYSEALANIYITEAENIGNINSDLYEKCVEATKLLEAEKILHPKNKWVRNSLGRAYILIGSRDNMCDIAILKKAEENFNGSISKNINSGKYIYFNLGVAQYLIASCYYYNSKKTNMDKCDCLNHSEEYFIKSKKSFDQALKIDKTFEKVKKQMKINEDEEAGTLLDLKNCNK